MPSRKERTVERLHEGFRFLKLDFEDTSDLSAPNLDDSTWESVTVPHDWGIGHDFDEDNDASYSEIVADGIHINLGCVKLKILKEYSVEIVIVILSRMSKNAIKILAAFVDDSR